MLIRLYFIFELRKMTSLADFKNKVSSCSWSNLSESQTAPFRSAHPKESPSRLGQDKSQLVIPQNAREEACPVIRVALGGNSARWKGGLRICGRGPLPRQDPHLPQGKLLHVLNFSS